MTTLSLTSVPKPATGIAFDGSLMGVVGVQAFVQQQGFVLTSMSMNADQNMKFIVNVGYYKHDPEGGGQIMYNTTIREGYVVVPDNSDSFISLTQAQFESDYTVNE